MNPIENRVRIAALGFATALALACTVGVSAAFDACTDNATFVAKAAQPHPTEVSINPGTIEVVATREAPSRTAVLGSWFGRHAS